MAVLLCCQPSSWIDRYCCASSIYCGRCPVPRAVADGGPLCRYSCACPPNVNYCFDLGCLGCGLPGCLAGTCTGFPVGMGYVVDLLRNRLQNYIERLVRKRKPRRILVGGQMLLAGGVHVCMIYYPDEDSNAESWASGPLACLGYDSNPQRIQMLIRRVFELATSKVAIKGCTVVPVPLYHALDGKDTADFVCRVEPSAQGGSRMANLLMNLILGQDLSPINDHSEAERMQR
eukprot:scaffold211_cov447-Prasinococcus_capsulatus_cf.AAC.7